MESSNSLNDEDIIRWGETLVVRMHDDKSTSVIKAKCDQKIGRSKVSVKNIVGAPYGSVFEIVDRRLERVADDDVFDNLSDDEDEVKKSADSMTAGEDVGQTGNTSAAQAPVVEQGDNSTYYDSNTAQKLQTADIKKMRESGASGLDIIKSLIANSDTWNAKTEFAQEKWLKRKQRKYIRRMRLIRATPASICEVYHSKGNKDKICGIRWDALAQVLSHSGVHPGCKVLVCETMVGLMVGSVAYRMKGHGQILALYGGQQPHFEVANMLNLDDASLRVICPIPSVELGPAAADVRSHGFLPLTSVSGLPVNDEYAQIIAETERRFKQKVGLAADDTPTLDSSNADAMEVNITATEDSSSSDVNNTNVSSSSSSNISGSNSSSSSSSSSSSNSNVNGNNGHNNTNGRDKMKGGGDVVTKTSHHSSGRQPHELIRNRRMLREGIDRLIIACRYHPLPILKEAIVLLAPSSPFVVYCEYMEPLVECFTYLHQESLAVRLHITDTWMREFQTLPGRVHPEMHMTTSAGFVLTGIYVGLIPQLQQAETIVQVDKKDNGNTKRKRRN